MKRSLIVGILILAFLVLGFFAFSFNSNSSGNSPSTNTENTQGASVEIPGSSTNGSADESAPSILSTTKTFNVIAKQFEFDPGVITVNQGDTVILKIKSIDSTHGFYIPEFGVSQTLSSGQEETVQFVADKKGTYTFFCNVYCGSGHSEMKGTLIVN